MICYGVSMFVKVLYVKGRLGGGGVESKDAQLLILYLEERTNDKCLVTISNIIDYHFRFNSS